MAGCAAAVDRGHGGIGKTTVALAVAEHEVGRHRDGTWLVDLSTLKEPDLSRGLACIDEAMALPEASGQRPAARGAGELIDVMASRTSGAHRR